MQSLTGICEYMFFVGNDRVTGSRDVHLEMSFGRRFFSNIDME